MSRGWGPAGGEVVSGKGQRKQGLLRIRRLGTYVEPYRLRLLGAIVAMFGVLACTLALPLLMKSAIDSAIIPRDTHLLVIIAGVVIGVGIVGIALSRVETYLTGWVGERVLNDLRVDLFQHMQSLSMGYFEKQRTGILISRLTNDVEALQQLVTDGLTSTVRNVLTLVVAGGILLFLDFRLALATIIVFPLMAILTFIFRGQSAKAYGQMRTRLALVTASLQEDLNGIRVIQAYRREAKSRAQIAVLNESYRDANRTTVTSSGWYFPTVEFLAAVATCIVFGYGGYLYVDGTIEIGVLVAFIGYLASFFDPVQQLSQVYNTFLAGTAALDKIFDVMDDAPTLVDAPDATALPALAGAVRFEQVRFGYNPERPVVDGLELDVKAGQTVALVGHTGAGKSTIIKLLARFYDPQSGRITIDGHDLRAVTIESLREQIAMVPQEGFLFNGTIHENISFGRPEASRAEVEAAAREVGADRFIKQLPDGYDEKVAERGSRLSIGQRQLIAFARALLVDPRLLILDEATSSVDIQTEAHIEEALARLLADRTAFVVAHRLSTIRNADLIVVLEHGKVVEVGSHDELLERGGRYRGLYGDWAEATAR
ncbi:MAG: ABC transporter ATP-binding protein [Actinobacteria bacterium]|nr:ABC transporter ATP-binding protein [Actinomycetota bacterium]